MDVISSTISIVQAIEQLIRSVKDRYQAVRDCPEKLESLLTQFKKIQSNYYTAGYLLDDVSEVLEENVLQLKREELQTKENEIDKAREILSEIGSVSMTDQTPWRRFVNGYIRVVRANKLIGRLDEVKSIGNNVSGSLDSFISFLSLERQKLSKDEFFPYFESDGASPNWRPSPSVTSETSSSESESLLEIIKEALSDDFYLRRTNVIALTENDGRWSNEFTRNNVVLPLSSNNDMRALFFGGIYYLNFEQCMPNVVIENIASIVQKSGGSRRAGRISSILNLDDAAQHGGEWFGGRCCLFVCANMQANRSVSFRYLASIEKLASFGLKSRILITTPNRQLAEKAGRLLTMDGNDSLSQKNREYLKMHARYLAENSRSEEADGVRDLSATESQQLDNYWVRASRKILEACSGIPLAVEIAGRCIDVLKKLEICDEKSAWLLFAEEIDKNQSQIPGGNFEGYHGLQKVINTIFTIARNIEESHYGNILVSAIERYCLAVTILDCKSQLPFSVFQRLWNIRDPDDVRRVLNLLEQLGFVVSESRNTMNGEVSIRYKVPDLILNYCNFENHNIHIHRTYLHSKLLFHYIYCQEDESGTLDVIEYGYEVYDEDKTRLDERTSEGKSRHWWDEKHKNDGYIHEKLVLHILSSGCPSEVEPLLLDFRWTARRLEIGDLLGLERDFDELEHFMERNLNEANQHENELALLGCRTLKKAIRAAWGYMVTNPNEVPFQLYARLVDLASNQPLPYVKKYLQSIESHAKKPWLRPLHRCLPGPKGPQIMEIPLSRHGLNGTCECLCYVGGEKLSGRNLIAAGVGCHVVLVNQEQSVVEHIYSGHTKKVRGVATTPNGDYIVSCSADCTVRVWNVFNHETDIGAIHREYGHVVHSVAVSPDGKFIASGLDDWSVQVSRFSTRELLYNPLRRHTAAVTSVAISSDSQKIVSGSNDKKICIWNLNDGTAISFLLDGHDGPVRSVAISSCNLFMASASNDTNVQIWGLNRRNVPNRVLRGHKFAVRSVAIHHDRNRTDIVASGSEDGTIRLWNLTDGSYTVLRGHSGAVTCVAMSPDGEFTASGSLDRTIRIWSNSTQEVGMENIMRHHEAVHSVFVSHDYNNEYLVSASYDGVAQVWKLPSQTSTFEAVGDLRLDCEDLLGGAENGTIENIIEGALRQQQINYDSRSGPLEDQSHLTLDDNFWVTCYGNQVTSTTNPERILGTLPGSTDTHSFYFDAQSNILVAGVSTGEVLWFEVVH